MNNGKNLLKIIYQQKQIKNSENIQLLHFLCSSSQTSKYHKRFTCSLENKTYLTTMHHYKNLNI